MVKLYVSLQLFICIGCVCMFQDICWIELLACLFCKILIAHCIYEGSLKKWNHDLWDLMKNASVCLWNPSQRADDVSTVLGVSVVNEFTRCPVLLLLTPPLLSLCLSAWHSQHWIHSRQYCTHRTTTGCRWRSTVRRHCTTTLQNTGLLLPHCLVKCRFCLPSYNVKWFTFGEVSW